MVRSWTSTIFIDKKSGKMISPLRYPGSKKRLSGLISQTLTLNQLTPRLYIEPFVGGGSVALRLLAEQLVEQVILMDIDPLVASFWDIVFNDTDWLINQVMTIPITLAQWIEFKHSTPTDRRSQALTCLFLNRTSFSGILGNSAGPMGGYEQRSDYPIDCRFSRNTIVERIEEISQYRDRVIGTWCCSWEAGIQRIHREQQEGVLPTNNLFYYLDPPFFKKAKKLYRFIFSSEEHSQLRDFLIGFNSPWLLSYDATEEFEELYGEAIASRTNGTQRQHIELLYTTAIQQNPRTAREVILSNLPHLPELNNL